MYIYTYIDNNANICSSNNVNHIMTNNIIDNTTNNNNITSRLLYGSGSGVCVDFVYVYIVL